MQARVTAGSQPSVFHDLVERAGVRHGEVVRADLRGLEVVGLDRGMPPEVRFCHLQPLSIRARLSDGEDDGPIPVRSEVVGLEVSASGRYDLENVLVSTNGRNRVVVDNGTRIRFRGPLPCMQHHTSW